MKKFRIEGLGAVELGEDDALPGGGEMEVGKDFVVRPPPPVFQKREKPLPIWLRKSGGISNDHPHQDCFEGSF